MHNTVQMEQFHIAYTLAMVATCGFNHSTPVVDDHSVDLDVFTTYKFNPNSPEKKSDPRVALQLKSTSSLNISVKNGIGSFVLKRKNYDDLRAQGYQAPRYLIILDLPKSSGKWLAHKKKFMALKKHCYWLSLKGLEEKNANNITVKFPIKQRFTTHVLTQMIEKARTGESYEQK